MADSASEAVALADASVTSTDSATTAKVQSGERGRWRSGRVLRVVRRVHMYLGLFLVPWLLLFGLSGVLFNHPNVGETVRGTPVPSPRLEAATGITPWNAPELAQQIVEKLNASPGSANYRLDASIPPAFHGPVLLTANYANGRHTALVDVERGRAFVISREARPGSGEVPFKQHLELEGKSAKAVEAQASGLLGAVNLTADTPLVANPRVAPELRFAIEDAAGVRYHVTYNTGSAELGGRLASSWSPVGVSQLMAMLHTTHHYTPYLSVRWAWALFQDLLGLAMAFWAISGLVMWWQLKATRIAGAVSVALALGLAAWIMWGTASELMFGEVMQTLGPG